MTEKDHVLDQIEKRKHFIENQKKHHDGTVSDEQRMKLEALETKCLNGEHEFVIVQNSFHRDIIQCKYCMYEK